MAIKRPQGVWISSYCLDDWVVAETRRKDFSASKDKEGCPRKTCDLAKPGEGTETLDPIPEDEWIVSFYKDDHGPREEDCQRDDGEQ